MEHGGNIYEKKIEIDFSASINPLGMPKGVRNAAISGIGLSNNYPDPTCKKLREALLNKYPFCSSDNFLIGNGAAELIYSTISYISKKKSDGAIYIPVPTFSEYKNAAKAYGLKVSFYLLKRENDFSFLEEDIEPFIKNIPENCSLVIFCNPGNPNGKIIDIEILEKLLFRIMDKNKYRKKGDEILILIDESFLPLTKTKNPSFIKKKSLEGNILVLRSFTKLYAMAGLRLGYIFGNEVILKNIRNFLQPWNVSIPAEMAGVAALKEEEFVNKSLSYIKKEREYLFSELEKLNLYP